MGLMSAVRRLLGRGAGAPEETHTLREQILDRLASATIFNADGSMEVPRGYFKSIAVELNCSDAYVSVIAKAAGYKVAGRKR